MATKPKYPKAVGACVDLLYTQRAERLELNRKVEEMKKAEDLLEDHILATFTKQELRGCKGDIATAAVKVDTTVNVLDWDALLAFTVKTKSWDILRKQPSVTAIKERWAAGKEVPGCEPFGKVSLSLTKAGS